MKTKSELLQENEIMRQRIAELQTKIELNLIAVDNLPDEDMTVIAGIIPKRTYWQRMEDYKKVLPE